MIKEADAEMSDDGAKEANTHSDGEVKVMTSDVFRPNDQLLQTTL
jgi:hypothetical protein